MECYEGKRKVFVDRNLNTRVGKRTVKNVAWEFGVPGGNVDPALFRKNTFIRN